MTDRKFTKLLEEINQPLWFFRYPWGKIPSVECPESVKNSTKRVISCCAEIILAWRAL